MQLDYSNPDYSAIFNKRAETLRKLDEDPKLLGTFCLHYKHHPWQMITDWGMCFEPRNLSRGRIAHLPFVLWPRQVDYIQWLHSRWLSHERGLVEKSRDCGVTWLSVGWSSVMWLFWDGFTAGFGSRKEELVDKKGDPDCIFEKIRYFVGNLPPIFLPAGFNMDKHSPYMRLINPKNGATIKGEGGNNIGRGGRSSAYFVDEAAFVENQDVVDAALSQNTDCQVDVSTPNGSGNLFYRKRQRFDKTPRIFVFDWRDDPRKNQAWYDKQCEEQDEVIVAQEIDRDYNASQEDAFIPARWVAAAIDAHKVLGFGPEGIRVTAFDPADVGDAKGVVNRHGSIILEAIELKTKDITQAIPLAFEQADEFRADVLAYDGDGMGAPAMKLTLQQRSAGRLRIVPYHGSAGVVDPSSVYGEESANVTRLKPTAKRTRELHDGSLKTNADLFQNYRSQTWTWARDRFRRTYDAVERAKKGLLVNVDPDLLISISSECKDLIVLQSELSRPKRIFRPNGKIMVESKERMRERGVQSPNLADSGVIAISIRRLEEQRVVKLITTPYGGEDDAPTDDGAGRSSWMGSL